MRSIFPSIPHLLSHFHFTAIQDLKKKKNRGENLKETHVIFYEYEKPKKKKRKRKKIETVAGCVGVYGFQVWAAKFAEEEEEEAIAAVMKMVRTTERAEVEIEMVVQKVCGPHVAKILVGQSFEVVFKLEVRSYI